jgi:S-adenosylmethionine hydrolase
MPGSLSPIITLTTDFGLADHYVAAMKGAILRHCPAARLVDVTHQIPRHDIIAGSIAIERAVDVFEEGTIHLGVVDPGVGSGRRILVVRIGGQVVVCPDNGLITWAWRRAGATVLSPSPGTPGEGWGGGFAGRRQPPPYPSPGVPREGTGVETEAFELLWRPEKYSAVFHGRDIMAPAVGILAAGGSLADLVRPITDPVLLGELVPAASLREGRVIHIDHFGVRRGMSWWNAAG